MTYKEVVVISTIRNLTLSIGNTQSEIDMERPTARGESAHRDYQTPVGNQRGPV
jgi:hypothetical protein